jgi:hypothetical protein
MAEKRDSIDVMIDAHVWMRRQEDAMLHGYFDESGTHRSSKVTMLAGLLGTQAQWHALNVDWMRTLGNYELPYFHATECEGGRGEFSKLDRPLREDLAANLAATIAHHNLTGVIGAIWKKDWDEFKKFPFVAAWPSPYYLCFQHCVDQLSKHPEFDGISEVISFTFATQDEYKARAIDSYRRIKQSSQYGKFMADEPIFLPAEMSSALQAADLLAFEFYQLPIKSERPPGFTFRRSMQALLAGQSKMIGGEINLLGLAQFLTRISVEQISKGEAPAPQLARVFQEWAKKGPDWDGGPKSGKRGGR